MTVNTKNVQRVDISVFFLHFEAIISNLWQQCYIPTSIKSSNFNWNQWFSL